MPTKITAITNQKGGVGKTTVCAALLSCLHQRGARVLGVDLDPQGSLGFSLGLDIEHCATVYDIFRGAAQPEEVIRQTDTCDILPSNILLSAAGNFSSKLPFPRSRTNMIILSSIPLLP